MSVNCSRLHEKFNKLPRHSFPYDKTDIPRNGIYVLFEKGEKAHGSDRVVRVGTHTGENQLPSRLNQHFLNENKDRSIFRKNIGRALLKKANDPFIKYWEIDLTPTAARKKYSDITDKEYQKRVERKVTKYIQDNFSFVVIAAENKEERLWLESRIISTVSACDECRPSTTWLGLKSPKEKIRRNGLWLVNELNKTPFSDQEATNFLSQS